jgi:hypothetical protein
VVEEKVDVCLEAVAASEGKLAEICAAAVEQTEVLEHNEDLCEKGLRPSRR